MMSLTPLRVIELSSDDTEVIECHIHVLGRDGHSLAQILRSCHECEQLLVLHSARTERHSVFAARSCGLAVGVGLRVVVLALDICRHTLGRFLKARTLELVRVGLRRGLVLA